MNLSIRAQLHKGWITSFNGKSLSIGQVIAKRNALSSGQRFIYQIGLSNLRTTRDRKIVLTLPRVRLKCFGGKRLRHQGFADLQNTYNTLNIVILTEVNNPDLSQHSFIMSIKTEPNVSVCFSKRNQLILQNSTKTA